MKNYLQRKFDIQHFAEGGDDKNFTQAELDEIVKNRLAAEKRNLMERLKPSKARMRKKSRS